MVTTPESLAKAAAEEAQAVIRRAALEDPAIRAAVAAADPETEGSLAAELDRRGISGPARAAVEAFWDMP